MEDLNDVLAFTHVADSGSFTRAAARLGWPKSTVSHRVARLEQSLGVRLLERSTRQLRLTEVGGRYHEQAKLALSSLNAASGMVASFQSRPQGMLRISASVVLGQALLPSLVAAFATAHPDVRLHIDLNNRRVDLLEEGIDLALRAGDLPDSSLVARRLGSVASRLYASPAYLRRHGQPRQPDALTQHTLLDCTPLPSPQSWTLSHDTSGETCSVAVTGQLIGNDPVLMREIAAMGRGIVSLPAFIAAPAVAGRQLRPVLREWATRRLDVHAVFPSHKSLSPAVRAFVDLSVTRLAPLLRASVAAK
ncbi:MAG: LysR family transcriptional regulator [Burkholderiales bacterium]|nr:LysR family transcriptional regulator [Burkholderiales bacterium]